MMKKILALILAAAMLLSLCACGKEKIPDKSEVTGEAQTYGCFTVLVPQGMELEPGDLLDESNEAAFTIKDSEEAFRYILIQANDEVWIDEGMDLTKEINEGCEFEDCDLKFDNAEFEGFSYVSGGVDCLELKGCIKGVYIQVTAALVTPTDGRLQAILESLEIDESKAPKTYEGDFDDMLDEKLDEAFGDDDWFSDDDTDAYTDSGSALTAVQERWNGWWYGGLDINGCTGGWDWINNTTYDAAMYVELDENGEGYVDLYEYGQLFSSDIPECFAELYCHADESYLYCDSGSSFAYEIEPRDWMFVPYTDNPDKIGMGTSFTDEDGDRFGYDLTLMPWGSTWDGEEDYTQFIPYFYDYLYAVWDGQIDPFGNYADGGDDYDDYSGDDFSSDGAGSDGSGNSELLGADAVTLDINDRGVVTVQYPGSEFEYDDDYGKIKSKTGGASIGFDPCLASGVFDEYKATFGSGDYTTWDDYEMYETTINGYRAVVCCGTDWLSSRMQIAIDFGGEHGDFYGMCINVSGDSLDDCQTDSVWAIINSLEVIG